MVMFLLSDVMETSVLVLDPCRGPGQVSPWTGAADAGRRDAARAGYGHGHLSSLGISLKRFRIEIFLPTILTLTISKNLVINTANELVLCTI